MIAEESAGSGMSIVLASRVWPFIGWNSRV